MRILNFVFTTVAVLCVPVTGFSQTTGEQISDFNGVLDNLYNEMLPLCSQLIGVGRGIAGFAALWYIASRVWRHLANAEPIDFYPLFRPFVLGACIAAFPAVIGVLRGVLEPTVSGTAAMVKNSDAAVKVLLAQKEEAIKNSPVWEMYVGQTGEGDRDKWYRYTYKEEPENESWYHTLGNNLSFEFSKAMYGFKSSVKQFMSEVLNLLFLAASLCINTLRTFQLVVLSILGPLVFGLAVFDGLQHTLTSWLARYINVFLWLPVANVFGAIIGQIQVNMLKLDLSQIGQAGNTYFSTTDTGYLIFLVIGIVGYFTVPSVAGFIVNAGGGGALMQRVTSIMAATPGAVMSGGKAAGGYAKESLGNYRNMGKYFQEGLSGQQSGQGISGWAGRMAGRQYMKNKVGGKDE